MLGLRRDRDFRSADQPLVDGKGKGEIMSRCVIAVLVSGLLMFTCGTLSPLSTRAQEGTPTAGAAGVEIAPGVTFELLPSSEDPPTLYRLRLDPGVSLPFVDDPAISLVYVESGALSLTLNAAVSDARPDVATAEDADQATELSQGDYFVLPPLVAGELRNSGQEPLLIVVAAITPGLIPGAAIGTPVA
jgi:Cupin